MQVDGVYARATSEATGIAAIWQGILDSIPAAAYTCDTSGQITFFSPNAEATWGRAPKLKDADDRYCGALKLYWPDGTRLAHDESYVALALRDGKAYNGKRLVLERPDGAFMPGLVHANLLRDPQGRIIGAVNVIVGVKKHTDADVAHSALLADIPYNAMRAIIEVALCALACASWKAGSSH